MAKEIIEVNSELFAELKEKSATLNMIIALARNVAAIAIQVDLKKEAIEKVEYTHRVAKAELAITLATAKI